MGHDLALEDEHQQDDPVIEEETLESAESTKSLVVKVNKVWMVYPQQPTKEEVIYMSNIDRMVQYPVELFFIYPPNPCKSSEGIFDVLREAMAKLLVPYHFMAGRFKLNKKDGGRLDIACNRQGATFIAASTESTVHDLGDIFHNLNPALRQVLPAPLPDVEDIDGPLLMIQVKSNCHRTLLNTACS
jgi:omega-hydroxypalmitate O-feruloyl transferase